MIGLRDRKRLVFLALGLFFLFSLLVVQFYKIQVIETDKWQSIAKAQHQITVSEPFKRGIFYGVRRVGPFHPGVPEPLVVDVPKAHLFVDSDAFPSHLKEEAAFELSKVLGVEKGKVLEGLQKKSRSRKVAMWLQGSQQEKVREWWRPFARKNKLPRNALYFEADFQRCYPHGKLLGQVLQTVREDREAGTHQAIPTGGLELAFHKYLKGKEGQRLLLRSPRHPLDLGKVTSPPVDGADVYLTIDVVLQAIAEEEIEKAVKTSEARHGWAAMMDPNTGEILALAQYPFFDPTAYKEYFNTPDKIEQTRIKAITDAFEPGSTMKPITLTIALMANEELVRRGESPLFSPEEKIKIDDGHFPGRTKPIRDVSARRYANMNMAIQKSSNIYMGRLVQRIVNRLGEEWYREQLSEVFQFGKKSGIEIPSESPGMLPKPGRCYSSGGLEWSTPTPYSLAIGYNMMANTVQMLRAWAILGNGGYQVRPTIVKKIERKLADGTKQIVVENPAVKGKKVVSEKVVNQIVNAMKFVTKPGGSAMRGDVPGYTEVGKTSTSEKIIKGSYSSKDHFTSFIGFAPAKNPRFVLMVAIDQPAYRFIPGIGYTHYGGKSAAPPFREIARRSLHYMGVPLDDPFGFPPGDPRYNEDKADWIKEAKALIEQGKRWND